MFAISAFISCFISLSCADRLDLQKHLEHQDLKKVIKGMCDNNEIEAIISPLGSIENKYTKYLLKDIMIPADYIIKKLWHTRWHTRWPSEQALAFDKLSTLIKFGYRPCQDMSDFFIRYLALTNPYDFDTKKFPMLHLLIKAGLDLDVYKSNKSKITAKIIKTIDLQYWNYERCRHDGMPHRKRCVERAVQNNILRKIYGLWFTSTIISCYPCETLSNIPPHHWEYGLAHKQDKDNFLNSPIFRLGRESYKSPMTIMMYAVCRGRGEVVKALLDYNDLELGRLDLHAKDEWGDDIYDQAERFDKPEVAQLLKSNADNLVQNINTSINLPNSICKIIAKNLFGENCQFNDTEGNRLSNVIFQATKFSLPLIKIIIAYNLGEGCHIKDIFIVRDTIEKVETSDCCAIL